MRLFRNIRIALRALRANKLRSLLTMLGIILGVGSVIATMAVGTGAQVSIQEEIKSIGSNLIVITPGSANSGGVSRGRGSRTTLTDLDARVIQAEVQSVMAAAPVVHGSGQSMTAGSNWTSPVVGVTPEYFVARDWNVDDGRKITHDDVHATRKVALLGQEVAEALFGDDDPIDKTIRIDRVPFNVIGILERKGQTLSGHDQDDVIMIPLTTARHRLFGRGQVNARSVSGITVRTHDSASTADSMEEIRDVLRAQHRLQPWQDDDFSLRNLSEILKKREEASRIMTALLASIAGISLLVGGIGIMNIMLVSIVERTREIGIRVAIGAHSGDILRQFLTEAVILSVLGGAIGVAVGIITSVAIAELGDLRVELHPSAILVALSFAAVVGLFFGYMPARRAARLDPIRALRFE